VPEDLREFGTEDAGCDYRLRPGGYAVIRNGAGEVAVVRTPEGVFLPGGGQLPGESPEDAAVRETAEESGLRIELGVCLGVADQLKFSATEGGHLRKRCTFFLARAADGAREPAIEADHELLWLSPEEAAGRLSDESQRWAVRAAPAGPGEASVPGVRRLRPEDGEAFIALRREALEREPFAFSSSAEEDRALSLDFLRRTLAGTNQAIFGGFAGTLVGSAGVYQDTQRKAAHKAHVWGVYVAPPHRRRGLGRSLMTAVLQFARGLPGVSQVHLGVADRGRAALALYERLGFVTWGTEPAALRIGDETAAEHHMVLTLD
jgi:ribosomal protein S18 acetylase RimI-like enzyme/8-oxo-dGTP pyrophosphatase MutT (NUDIX family)